MAFEAAEQEASTREPAHVVGAHDDAREVPDGIRHASFEPEDVPLGGPAGMLPPEVPEDTDHRHPAIDGSSDPIADLPQHRVGRLLPRDRVKAIAPPELVRSEPAALEAGQEAPVCRVVAKEDADLVALHSRREKACRRIKLVLGLPEVADVVTRRRDSPAMPRGTLRSRGSLVKAPGSEEVEESVSLGTVFLSLAATELRERAHDELHLRQVRATPRAGPPVRFAALMIAPGQGSVQVGGDDSTSSRHGMSVENPICSSPSFEIWLERRPHLRPGPVQEHSPIGLLNAEGVTHLLRRATLDVPKGQERAAG